MTKLLIPALLSALIVGCSSTPVDETSGAPVESRNGSSGVASVTAGGLDSRGLPRELTDPKSALAKRSIYFDFDSFVVKPEYQPLVDQHARFLQANRGRGVALEGHTDERGSREYNLALGQKRAEAVRRALTLVGASDAQVEAVSFGEEKPAVAGSTEDAYAKNRRVEIRYR